MDVGREIGNALQRINAEDAEDALRERRRQSLRILQTIPNGTSDADLTTAQAAAWDEYETTGAALTALREENER